MLPTEELSCGWKTSVQQTVTKDRSLAVTGLSFRLKFYFLLFKNNFIEIILQSSIEKSYCIQEGLYPARTYRQSQEMPELWTQIRGVSTNSQGLNL